ncbi:hypothetical protein SAMN05216499_1646 [Actinacidiphila paucisporea]|uniref:Uncharacterized protein n=1 Tax=Actinacidiphila paucisporea TaxID=310782 RepID=A0A1M7R0S5_9ACTN|nr:hypothetical protein SAMN05216499_1646 [Actinacidiphila paucisporea]
MMVAVEMHWKGRYPLPEPAVRRLQQFRWLYAGFSLLELTSLVAQLAGGGRGWGVWANGAGLVLFAGLGILATRQLQHHRAAETRSAPPPS